MALSKDTGTPTGQGLVTILLERLFDLFTDRRADARGRADDPGQLGAHLAGRAEPAHGGGLGRMRRPGAERRPAAAGQPPGGEGAAARAAPADASHGGRGAGAAALGAGRGHGAGLVVRGLGGAAGFDPDGGARGRPRPRLAQRRDGAGRHHVRPGDPVLRREHRGVRGRRSPGALHLRGRVGRRPRVRARLPRRLGAAPAAARRGRRRAHGHTLPAGFAPCACR